MSKRRTMHGGDWFNTAINVVFGFLLGSPVHDLMQLAKADFWLVVLLTPPLFAGFFLCVWVVDSLLDRLFPSGIRPAQKAQRSEGTPLLRLVSLPAALVVGVLWAAI